MGEPLAGGLKGRENREEESGERHGESRQTAHWKKCDLGCPITTPWQNTTDKAHAEWKRQRGRQGEEDRVKGGEDKQQRGEGVM